MADPFSTAAAAISLVDVALKSVREIHSIITSLKNAPDALRQAQETVCEVQGLLEDLQCLEAAYRQSSMPHLNPQTLSRIRRTVKSINEDLATLRDKIEEPIFVTDSRSRRFLKSFRFYNNERSISKTCSRMEQKAAFIRGTLSVIGSNNDLFQIGQLRTTNESIQLVSQGQTQLRNDTLGLLHSNAAVSQQLLQEQQHTHVDMLDGHAQIRADIHSIQPSWFQRIPQILLHEGSACDANEVMLKIRRFLPSILAQASLPGTTMNDLGWVEKELSNTLSGMQVLAASEIQGGLNLAPYGTRRTTQPIALQVLNHLRSQSSSVLQRRSGQLRKRQLWTDPAEEMELVIPVPEGNLHLWVTDGCKISSDDFSSSLKGFRVMFTPNQHCSLPGLSASFVESAVNGLRLPPAIRTFGIVPRECAIIYKICEGDTEEVRAILQREECSAADRDKYGNCLLFYAILEKRYDICYLLIQWRADPLDCTARGNTALEIFFECWDPEDEDVHFEDYIRLFATSGCFECDRMIVTYKRGRKLGLYPEPFLFSAIRSSKAKSDQLRFLLTKALDINEVGGFGKPLLCEAAITYYTDLVPLGRSLLKAGADVQATDWYGDGVINHYVHRLSVCVASKLNGQQAEDMTLFLHELLSQGASLRNSKGWSLTDTAITPAAWVIWCNALDRSGIDIEDLLRGEDELRGLQQPSSEDTKGLVGDITGPNMVTAEMLSDEQLQGMCKVCGIDFGICYYRPPFDLKFRYLDPKFQRHELGYRHDDGLPCSNFVQEDTCVKDDHDDTGMPIVYSKDFSIRYWAAYRLWRDGWLTTTEDAEFWASNVMTQEAFDSFHHLSAIRL